MGKKGIIAIVVAIILIVCSIYFMNSRDTDAPNPVPAPDPVSDPSDKETSVDINLYFADELDGYLVKEKVSYKAKEQDKYLIAVKKLIEGPKESGHYPTVNSKTIVNNVTVSDKKCVVDFDESLFQYNTGGSSREMMCLYSIVNTLCEFEEVDSVIFTVNGKSIETFGQLDMTESYEADLSIVK